MNMCLKRTEITFMILMACTLTAGCVASLNYRDPAGPRYIGNGQPVPVAGPAAMRVVTFNLKYGQRVSEAVALLRTVPALSRPDLLLLQEMDETGARAAADSLGMNWVYYPAARLPNTKRDFGNAVLTPWPIVDDRKIILPHWGRIRKMQRAAVAATVVVDGTPIRVYSVHIATMISNGPGARREQLAAVLDDAESYPNVVIAGDFNSETVPEIAARRGYAWPSRRLPHTDTFWTFDHILLRGVSLASGNSIGVSDSKGASDHKAVWALLQRTGIGSSGQGGPPGR